MPFDQKYDMILNVMLSNTVLLTASTVSADTVDRVVKLLAIK